MSEQAKNIRNFNIVILQLSNDCVHTQKYPVTIDNDPATGDFTISFATKGADISGELKELSDDLEDYLIGGGMKLESDPDRRFLKFPATTATGWELKVPYNDIDHAKVQRVLKKASMGDGTPLEPIAEQVAGDPSLDIGGTGSFVEEAGKDDPVLSKEGTGTFTEGVEGDPTLNKEGTGTFTAAESSADPVLGDGSSVVPFGEDPTLMPGTALAVPGLPRVDSSEFETNVPLSQVFDAVVTRRENVFSSNLLVSDVSARYGGEPDQKTYMMSFPRYDKMHDDVTFMIEMLNKQIPGAADNPPAITARLKNEGSCIYFISFIDRPVDVSTVDMMDGLLKASLGTISTNGPKVRGM